MVTPLLGADNLVRRYGSRAVLDGVTLHVNPGEVLALTGPNGAGKSTLFRLLLLLERPDAGNVLFEGQPVRGRLSSVRPRLAGVFQRAVLFSGTVRDNIGYGLRIRGVPRAVRQRRVGEAIGWFGLDELGDASVHQLSGGEAQRVALARALVTEPDVLLLDEPASGLDASMRRRFRTDIEQIARRHARAIMIVTHDQADAFGLADRVAVMERGRIVQVATPEQIMLRPATPFAAELAGAELLLHGAVDEVHDGLCRVRIAPDVALWASAVDPPVPVGRHVVVAYRPEDVLLGAGGDATSALNRVPCRVLALEGAGAVVRVLLQVAGAEGVQLTALLTSRSATALSLQAGSGIVAYTKATALHAWERSTHAG